MPETIIQDVHPGEKVFHSSRHQCLFTSSLSPQDCGFRPGSGELDSYLCSCQGQTKSLLMSELLAQCSKKFSDFNTILNWVFLIMSVHKDALVVKACQQTMAGHMGEQLQELLQSGDSGRRRGRFWAPHLHVVVRAFLNMGTQLEEILPDQSFLSSDQLREATMRTGNENAAPAPAAAPGGGEEEEERELPKENLQAVLVALSLVLQARPRYSEKELSALFLMVAKISLDQGLRDSYLEYELSSCLESILEAFPNDSLNRAVPNLCRQLCQMVEHHHNRVYLCSLLPKGGACCRMRQGFALLALHQMLGLPEPSSKTLLNVQVQDCLPLVSHLDQLLQQLYVLHSAVQLLDCSVGSTAAFRPDSGLQQLNSSLQPLRGRIRETGGNLDASKVKNAMVKLNSKWTLLLNAFSHTKPFKSPGPMESLEADELEDSSSPERKSSETAEETLVETGYENEDCPYIVDSDEDMLPDI